MKSEFEEMCKIASHVGAAQAFDKIRQKHGLEDPERFTKLAFGAGIMKTFGKSLPAVQGAAKKAPMFGTKAKVGLGALGGATVGGAAGFGGGANYGAKKMENTLMTNMSNQGFLDKLKTLFYYLTNNMQGVRQQLGGGQYGT
tara:strand:- start:2847 stop:3272 length:426 start_codon:yes stop_codon:yes gene_type:complete